MLDKFDDNDDDDDDEIARQIRNSSKMPRDFEEVEASFDEPLDAKETIMSSHNKKGPSGGNDA